MLRFLRIPALLFLALILICGCVLVYWQATRRFPSEEDSALYLVVMPISLVIGGFISFLGIRAIVRRVRAKPDSAEASTPEAARTVGPSVAEMTAHRERSYAAAIVGAYVNLPMAEDATTALEKLTWPNAEVPLDTELKREEGFPIYAARVAAVRTETMIEELQAVVTSAKIEAVSRISEIRETFARALAVLAAPLDEAITALAMVHDEQRAAHEVAQSAQLVRHDLPADSAFPFLRIVFAIPADWSDSERLLALTWLNQRLIDLDWPAQASSISTLAIRQQNDLLMMLDRSIIALNQAALPELMLVVATESYINADLVEKWDDEQRLHHGKLSDGLKPGEAAAALLLTRADGPLVLQPKQAARLHRFALGRRSQSAEVARTPGDLTDRLSLDAMTAVRINAAQIGALLTDGDHRAYCSNETFQTVTELLHHLDKKKEIYTVGEGCGFTGMAGTLVTIALGSHAATIGEKPVLVASIVDPFDRGVTVIIPALNVLETSAPPAMQSAA